MSLRDVLNRLFGVSAQPVESQRWIGDSHQLPAIPSADLNLSDSDYGFAEDEAEVAGDDAEAAADLDSRVAFPADSFEDYYTPAAYSTPGYTTPGYAPAEVEPWETVSDRIQYRAGSEREASREERDAAPVEAGDVDAPQGWYAQGAQAYRQLAEQARAIGRDEQAEVFDAYAGQFAHLHDEAEVDAAIETAAGENSAEMHEREAREYRDAAESLPRDSDTVDRMLEAAKQHEEEARLFRLVEDSATAAREAAAEATREDIPDTSRFSRDASHASRDDTCAGY